MATPIIVDGTTPDTLDIVRQHVGRRHRITRAEMRAILTSLAESGLDLGNDCVFDASPERWEQCCACITVVSVLPDGDHGRYHGRIRYDAPGSMAPGQRAALMFVSVDLAEDRHGCDPIGYLRPKTGRLLIVTGEPARVAPVTSAGVEIGQQTRTGCECPNGHRWQTDDDQRDEAGYGRCPTCDEWWC